MNNTTGKRMISMALIFLAAATPWTAAAGDRAGAVERGRYLVKIAGCNDCHTAAYMEQEGKVPEAKWLMGDDLGWRGPWGTTYAVNLRLYFSKLSEAQWLLVARQMRTRPPMPWFTVAEMKDDDLRAIYAFVRALGPGGEAAPAYLPPDQDPPPPYILFP